MSTESRPMSGYPIQLIRVRTEPDGQVTAEAVGLPDVRATAGTREVAIWNVKAHLNQMLARGELVPVHWPQANPVLHGPRIDPNDPAEQEFLQELARMKQEDLERTLREYEAECPDSSSTPTT